MAEDTTPLSLRDALRWDGLVALAPLLVSTLERDQLLRWILWMALHVVDGEACTLALTNLDTGELEYAVVLGEKEQEARRFRVRSGEGILGWVALHGKPVFAPDVTRHPLWQRDVAEKIGFPTRAIVCVPLVAKEQTFGALEVINKRGGATFTDEDLEILTAFGSVAAVCVENSRLYQWLTRRADEAEVNLLGTNRELARKKAELDAVISTMSDGLVILDSDGRVSEINPAAEAFLHLHRAEVMGIRLSNQPFVDGPLSVLLPAVSEGTAAVACREWTLSLADGRTATCRVSPFSDDAGNRVGMALVMSDITALADVSRMKSEFVAYVAHELKTPLACVRGYADLLLPPIGDTLTEEEHREFLGIIRSEADRTTRLIHRLLNAARIEAGRGLDLCPASTDLAALAARVIETVRGISTNHTLAVVVEGEVPSVLADTDQIEEVLLNLATNAVKYSPHGGRVTVRIIPVESGLHVEVSDQGIGMTPEEISRLFGRYQRGLAGRKGLNGTGLGLYLSKGIVEAHGGSIWVESAPGEGSVFHFTLPSEPPFLGRAQAIL